jgi:tyrosyl-tRNA synthetase
MTALVHGDAAAQAADEAADVLFGGDPTTASEAALSTVAGEVPSSDLSESDLGDVVEALVRTGLASSKGDARRTLEGNGFRCNGRTLEADSRLDQVERLHGRYLLLQRGKKSHHLVTVGT